MTLAPRAPRVLADLAALLLLAAAVVALVRCEPAYAGRTRPTIHPVLAADCVQGPVCAAPAVVRLDSLGTTADGVERPFHDLAYSWDCGDGQEPVSAPISACTYDRPGEYVVTLRVEHEGESALAATRVVVLDRSAVRVVELESGSRVASVALGTGPGLLTTKGPTPAVVTGTLSPPDGWTIARVDFEGGCVQLPPERSRVTLLDVTLRACRDGGVVSMTGGGTRHSDLVAIVRTTIHSAPTARMPGIFLRAERAVILDALVDGGTGYNLRTVHFPGLLLARSRIEALGAGSNAVQLRAWGGTGPPNTASDGFVVADNDLVAATPATAVVRTCQTNTCADDTATAADVTNGLFVGNRLLVTGSSAPPPSIGFWVQGGDLTLRGNSIECPGCAMTGPGSTRLVQQLRDSTRKAGLAHDRRTVEPRERPLCSNCAMRDAD